MIPAIKLVRSRLGHIQDKLLKGSPTFSKWDFLSYGSRANSIDLQFKYLTVGNYILALELMS